MWNDISELILLTELYRLYSNHITLEVIRNQHI